MKLKTKFTGLVSKTRLFFIFALFLSLAGGFLPANLASADSTCGNPTNVAGTTVTCDLSQIQLKTDVQINGQTGNFVRVGQDGSFTFTVTVTLVSPASLTFIGTDIGVVNSKNPFVLSGVGTTATPFDSSKVCSTAKKVSTDYTQCSNPPFDQTYSYGGSLFTSAQSKNFQAGQVIYTSPAYTVNSGNFAKLGITQQNNGSDSTSGINQFYVYPQLIAGISDVFTNTFTDAKNSVFVQYYKTQAQATTANASGQQPPACASGQTTSSQNPACVPVYGSTTGAGNNLNLNPTDPIATFISQVINFLLGLIQEIIYAVFSFLVAPVIQAMLSIQAYKDTFVAVIYPGWIIVRNLCDMIFIVALIVIAMATLLRIESYQYKHLLVQLILAALLINFSLITLFLQALEHPIEL